MPPPDPADLGGGGDDGGCRGGIDAEAFERGEKDDDREKIEKQFHSVFALNFSDAEFMQ